MKYQNIKNGAIIEVTATDDVRKTVEVKYEADGRTTNLSMSTLKRWWKPLGNDVPETKAEEETEKAGDGTPLEEVGKEIAEQAKQKAEKAKAAKEAIKKAFNEKKAEKPKKSVKKAENPEVPVILEFIDETAKKAGISFYVREKQPDCKQYRFDGGKVIFITRILKHRVEIHCKSRMLDEDVAVKMQTMKGFFDKKVDIESLTTDNKKLITDIIGNFKKEAK